MIRGDPNYASPGPCYQAFSGPQPGACCRGSQRNGFPRADSHNKVLSTTEYHTKDGDAGAGQLPVFSFFPGVAGLEPHGGRLNQPFAVLKVGNELLLGQPGEDSIVQVNTAIVSNVKIINSIYVYVLLITVN